MILIKYWINMKNLIFTITVFMLVVSCKTMRIGNSSSDRKWTHNYGGYPTVFLDIDYNGIVQLVDGNKTIRLQNNDLEENFILFSLIKKIDNSFEVIAWNSYDESYIGTGKIHSNTPICIYTKENNPEKNPIRLYADHSLNSSFVSDTTYSIEALRVVDVYKKWLKVKMLINGKVHIGWLSPDMQCPLVYTTCN